MKLFRLLRGGAKMLVRKQLFVGFEKPTTQLGGVGFSKPTLVDND